MKKNITSGLFWLAFISFLGVSIPHVAYVYHSYEPDNIIFYWVVSYAVAVGIDVMICWLSFIQSTGKNGIAFITWVFIGALTLLSWYCNFLYTMAHNPQPIANLWDIPIFFGVTTTGYFTPILISGIPLFIIGYTFMLSRLSSVKHETLAEKVTRLEAEKVLKDRLARATEGRVSNFIKGAITGASDVITHAKNTIQPTAPSQSSQDSPQQALQPTGDNLTSLPVQAIPQPLQPQSEAIPQPEEVLTPEEGLQEFLQAVASVILPTSVSQPVETAIPEEGSMIDPMPVQATLDSSQPQSEALQVQEESTPDEETIITAPSLEIPEVTTDMVASVPAKSNGHSINLDGLVTIKRKKK